LNDVAKQLADIERGLVDIITRDELVEKLERYERDGTPLKIKVGFDPSAPDIHIGHAVALRKMRQLQDLGHDVYCVIGDFTGQIGDPSGRSQTRPQLSREEVEANAQTYKQQVTKILDPERLKLVYNSEWFSPLSFDAVIDIASRYTVARLLERDDFNKRFTEQQPITLLELFYPLVQAYDSVAIEADIEMGGTDQTFNMLVGRDLQRSYGQEPQVVLTTPLLVGLDGEQKMSKSLGNYIGIDEEPREIFGKTMSISDEMMWEYLELCTDVPLDDIGRMRNEVETGNQHPKDAKKSLATELVAMYHNNEAAARAEQEFEAVFVNKQLPDDIPVFELPASELKDGGIWVARLLVLTGMASSNGEARRLITGGGVRLNGETVDDASLDIQPEDGMILQVGKRRFMKVVFGS